MGRDLLSIFAQFTSGSPDAPESTEQAIPITEDLMREHGALNRLLLIYEELIKRIEYMQFPKAQIFATAQLVRDFIENYHEKVEEDLIFPLF